MELNKKEQEKTLVALTEALISLNDTTRPSAEKALKLIKERLKFFGFYDGQENLKGVHSADNDKNKQKN